MKQFKNSSHKILQIVKTTFNHIIVFTATFALHFKVVHLRPALLHLHFPEQDLRQPQWSRVEHAVDLSFSVVFSFQIV